MKLPIFWRGLLLGGCLMIWSTPTWAQPQPNPRQISNYWLELRRKWSATELTDPQSAIDAYEKFYRSLSDTNGEVGVEVVSRVAQIYGSELGQRDRALQIYEEAMKRWRAPELLNRLVREHDLMSGAIQEDMTPGVSAAFPAPVREIAPVGLQVAPEARARIGTLVEMLAAGQDAKTVWARGEWKSEDVVWALENIIRNDGILQGRPREGKSARESLANLLAQYGGDLVSGENWRLLPSKTRLWLGDYYRRDGDDRAVSVLESVVSELEERDIRSNGEDSLLFAGIERLAWFYRDHEKKKIAAQTWLRLPPLLSDTDWRKPDALLEAAHFYKETGNDQKAKTLYDQVPQYGHGLFTGLALYDQASTLIRAGKHDEARVFLKQNVTGKKADESQIALLSLLASSYMKTNETDSAKGAAQEAIDSYQALDAPKRSDSLTFYTVRAKKVLRWAESRKDKEKAEAK